MAVQYTRGQVIARIKAEIDAKRFLLMQGAGIGLIARLVEQAGVDLIAVYNTGYYRCLQHRLLPDERLGQHLRHAADRQCQ